MAYAPRTLRRRDGGTLTDGATITIDLSLGNAFVVTLGGAGRLIAFSNHKNGDVVRLRIVQDGTGSRTIDWVGSGIFRAQGSGVPPVLSLAAGAEDWIEVEYVASVAKWYILGFGQAYANCA